MTINRVSGKPRYGREIIKRAQNFAGSGGIAVGTTDTALDGFSLGFYPTRRGTYRLSGQLLWSLSVPITTSRLLTVKVQETTLGEVAPRSYQFPVRSVPSPVAGPNNLYIYTLAFEVPDMKIFDLALYRCFVLYGAVSDATLSAFVFGTSIADAYANYVEVSVD